MKNKDDMLKVLFSATAVSVLTFGGLLSANLMAEGSATAQVKLDDTKLIQESDGSKIVRKSDGTSVEINSDGSKIEVKSGA
jgi:hypothetical protein